MRGYSNIMNIVNIVKRKGVRGYSNNMKIVKRKGVRRMPTMQGSIKDTIKASQVSRPLFS